MRQPRKGRVVWHDLFTGDRPGAMAFYGRVAGWSFRTEHAVDFAWGGGAKDFVLALSEDEAGAGLAETPAGLTNGWIAYVEVPDVDAAATRAEELGGAVVRQPFDVPGVGRNALLRDPLGAVVGISLSQHGFPVPRRQFGLEVYLSNAQEFPRAFYRALFDWTSNVPGPDADDGYAVAGPSGEAIAMHLAGKPPNGERAIWVPSIKVGNPDKALHVAEELGAGPLIPFRSANPNWPVLQDPEGVPFRLQVS